MTYLKKWVSENYKMKSNQLRIGTRVEGEHKKTYKFLSHYLKTHKRLPPQGVVFKSIAKDHLREHKNYYQKLRRARL